MEREVHTHAAATPPPPPPLRPRPCPLTSPLTPALKGVGKRGGGIGGEIGGWRLGGDDGYGARGVQAHTHTHIRTHIHTHARTHVLTHSASAAAARVCNHPYLFRAPVDAAGRRIVDRRHVELSGKMQAPGPGHNPRAGAESVPRRASRKSPCFRQLCAHMGPCLPSRYGCVARSSRGAARRCSRGVCRLVGQRRPSEAKDLRRRE
jgi:hypothetical protein